MTTTKEERERLREALAAALDRDMCPDDPGDEERGEPKPNRSMQHEEGK